MPHFVTLTEVKHHLRIDSAEDDQRITMLIAAASEYAEAFCKRTFPDLDQARIPTPLPPSVKAAVLLIIGDLMENPSADINQAAQRLLWPHRQQVFA